MKRFITAFLLSFILFTVLTSTAEATGAGQNAAAPGILLGIYYGDQGWHMDKVQALEHWQGKKQAVVTLFSDWDPKWVPWMFSDQLPNIWNNQNIPLITWMPSLGASAPTPSNIDVLIAQGQQDSYLNNWADKLKVFLSGADGQYGNGDDRRVYIRLAHEMNIPNYAWGAAGKANTPADYINMWRHVYTLFQQKGLEKTHVQFIWCVNGADDGGYAAEQFYPGDSYVDWVGMDSYNWGTTKSWSHWTAPAALVSPMLKRLRTLTSKPVAISEFAATTSGASVAQKSRWVHDFFTYARANNIKMVSWFNEDKETDWAIFGGAHGDTSYTSAGTTYRGFGSYKKAVHSRSVITTSPTNPRLLNDSVFGGG